VCTAPAGHEKIQPDYEETSENWVVLWFVSICQSHARQGQGAKPPCYTISMDIDSVVTQLKQELARINQAIAALEILNRTGPRRRRASKVSQSMQASRPRRRTMSEAARAKIAAAQRARWAKQRASATTTKATPVKTKGRRMSPAARKRLSALMKARWAARKRASRQRAA
jgi:hypothetical protein